MSLFHRIFLKHIGTTLSHHDPTNYPGLMDKTQGDGHNAKQRIFYQLKWKNEYFSTYIFSLIILSYPAILAPNTTTYLLIASSITTLLLLSLLHSTTPPTLAGTTGILASTTQISTILLTPHPALLPLQLSLLATTLYTSINLLKYTPTSTKPLYLPLLASLPLLPTHPNPTLTALALIGAAILHQHLEKRPAPTKTTLTLSLATLYTALAPPDPTAALKTALLALAILALPAREAAPGEPH